MSNFPLKVNGARAVIKLDEVENKTLGGIIIQSAESEPVNKGTVMAVGPGQRLDNGTVFPMSIAVGDHVLFSPMAGAPVTIPGDDNKYLVINEGHVLAIFE